MIIVTPTVVFTIGAVYYYDQLAKYKLNFKITHGPYHFRSWAVHGLQALVCTNRTVYAMWLFGNVIWLLSDKTAWEQDSADLPVDPKSSSSTVSSYCFLPAVSVFLDVTHCAHASLCMGQLVNFSKNTADIFLSICSQLHPTPSLQIDASPYFIVVLLISTVLVSGA